MEITIEELRLLACCLVVAVLIFVDHEMHCRRGKS